MFAVETCFEQTAAKILVSKLAKNARSGILQMKIIKNYVQNCNQLYI